jgi:Predicted membrane protein
VSLLLRWGASAFAVALAAHFVPGIYVEGGIPTLLAVALILGLANALVRPLLRFLACSLIFLTLGLFLLVINAAMLLLTAFVAGQLGLGFAVDGFVPALLGSLLISVVSFLFSLIFTDRKKKGDR